MKIRFIIGIVNLKYIIFIQCPTINLQHGKNGQAIVHTKCFGE
jgi:hypothetical protein